MGEFSIGQSISRFEDPRLLRGGGRYVDDVALPNMAYGYVLRSPHAHALIRSIDTAAAKAAPGVLLVLTGKDWFASGFGPDLPRGKGLKKRDGAPMYSPPYPALVGDCVKRVGDYVAFVVAETREQAMDAAELIEVDYAPLPSVTGTEAALAPDAPTVWPDNPGNVCYVHTEGDKAATDAAFARADHVVSHKFVINRVSANSMEPRGCVGHYDAAADHYTLYTTLQGLQPYRSSLAQMIGATESRVHVIAGDVGGGFGMKSAIYNEMPLSLLASRMIGRPVKWNSTRSEALLSDGHARDCVSEASLALDRGGKFLGMRVKNTVNIGAYVQQGGENSGIKNLGTLAGVYTTPAIDVEVTTVFTNTNPMRAYRGNGRPEAAFIIERLVDMAADEMGIDPAALRRRNTIAPDALPFQTALGFNYDCGAFEKNMDMALDLAGYGTFEQRRSEARERGRLRGIGISNTIERAGSEGNEGVEIKFDRSGTVTIGSGSLNQGQGHETMYKQLAAAWLGLDPADMRYIQGDSDKVPDGRGSFGSRSATIGGTAMKMASEKIVAKATRIAAKMLESDPEEVEFEDGIFSSKASNRTLTLKEVARASHDPKNLPDGEESGLVAVASFTAHVNNYPNGAHICEVEIDEETGKVAVVRYSVVDDVGTVINPLLLKGQIHGGIAQGLGQVLMEDIHYDSSGQLVTGSFMDYCMPRADDMSFIEVKSNPVPTKTNPLGVKGAGEAGNVGALPAVANAIVDALSVYGVKHVPMPATPEAVWRAIRDGKAANGG
jgi:aerobic carbon-monoxide dehydrogenase large subunit